MTAAVKTDCPNARSLHFGTQEEAEAEMLDRKIKDACWGKRGKPITRHVERCSSCGTWMIVSSEQRGHRSSRR